jgi:hypothetical protein
VTSTNLLVLAPNFNSSLGGLDLGISAVMMVQIVHRRDAENAEVAQRI